MTTPFEVHHRAEDATCYLSVAGEVDLSTGPALTNQIYERLNSATVTHLVVDLTRVSFLDSSGINALIRGVLRAQETGKQLRVQGAAGRVRNVLDVTGVSEVLGLESTP